MKRIDKTASFVRCFDFLSISIAVAVNDGTKLPYSERRK